MILLKKSSHGIYLDVTKSLEFGSSDATEKAYRCSEKFGMSALLRVKGLDKDQRNIKKNVLATLQG